MAIKRVTAAEALAMRSQTDLARVRAKTEADLARDTAEDEAWNGVAEDWYVNALPAEAVSKSTISIRLDPDVIEWFKAGGAGYQTRMNAVLKAYVEHMRRRK